jgi:hypothetical protein
MAPLVKVKENREHYTADKQRHKPKQPRREMVKKLSCNTAASKNKSKASSNFGSDDFLCMYENPGISD